METVGLRDAPSFFDVVGLYRRKSPCALAAFTVLHKARIQEGRDNQKNLFRHHVLVHHFFRPTDLLVQLLADEVRQRMVNEA